MLRKRLWLYIIWLYKYMVQELSLAFKADNIEECFILSDISFHKLSPGIDIVPVPKCAVCILLAKCIPFLKL